MKEPKLVMVPGATFKEIHTADGERFFVQSDIFEGYERDEFWRLGWTDGTQDMMTDPSNRKPLIECLDAWEKEMEALQHQGLNVTGMDARTHLMLMRQANIDLKTYTFLDHNPSRSKDGRFIPMGSRRGYYQISVNSDEGGHFHSVGHFRPVLWAKKEYGPITDTGLEREYRFRYLDEYPKGKMFFRK